MTHGRPTLLFLAPPFVQLNTPYPATAALVGWLRSHGYDAVQRDLSVEVALDLLRLHGGDEAEDCIEVLRNPALSPEEKRGAADRIDALALAIRDRTDPDFGLSRYAESLAVSVPDFGAVTRRLRRRTQVDRLLEERTAAVLAETAPDIVGVTCPFPGTLLGAFRIARTVRRLAPHVKLVLGGGYVNTELRLMNDRRPYRYFDEIMYDEGYGPWLRLLGAPEEEIPPFVAPSYHGLDLSLYFDLPETDNPMQRLWSCGKWIKMQLARGCYWHRCAFCDVNLDYIRCFAVPKASAVVDAMERLAAETGERGFHFTDEAIPPALARGISEEIRRRRFGCRWWGNVRFDGAYTKELARLMARAGCIAVTGGLECAHDRLLALMNKGITCASARVTLENFAEAGILAHAYLMYGFPTQTEQETKSALRYVRNLFREGVLQSAYFHRFALTVHSPIARDPGRYGVRIPKAWQGVVAAATGRADAAAVLRGHRLFALNEVPFEEPGAPDWTRIGKVLRLALYNYMQGRGLAKSADFWFENV